MMSTNNVNYAECNDVHQQRQLRKMYDVHQQYQLRKMYDVHQQCQCAITKKKGIVSNLYFGVSRDTDSRRSEFCSPSLVTAGYWRLLSQTSS